MKCRLHSNSLSHMLSLNGGMRARCASGIPARNRNVAFLEMARIIANLMLLM